MPISGKPLPEGLMKSDLEISWNPFAPGTEADALASFLCASTWPYHVYPSPERAIVLPWIESGRFGNNDDARGFWGVAGTERVAFLAVQELEDPTPVFDLRIASPWRRRGIGRSALRFVAAWAFGEGQKHRIEAHTRADNLAMRGLLRAEGWVQEAHHRCAWPDHEGAWHDAVTYALLRDDLCRGTRTPRPPLDV
jgi:RimJ/RimL family protein N-acetyltransferase